MERRACWRVADTHPGDLGGATGALGGMEKWGLRFGKLVPKVKPRDQIKTWRILRGDMVVGGMHHTEYHIG